jgi:DNA-binding IscR family transcriptional regulator
LHSHWKGLRVQIEQTLESTTLADLAGIAKRSRRRRSRRVLAKASAAC